MTPSGGRQRPLLRLKSRWRMVQARSSKGTRRVWACALIAAFATVIIVGKPLPFVVDATEYAIVTDFGKPTQVITSPGLGFKRAYESIRTLDRRLFVYVSPATELAQARRGEGDAEAARIYGQAVGQAPDFYGFLRTMETSRKLTRQRTTIVLSADPRSSACSLTATISTAVWRGAMPKRRASHRRGSRR
jgi:regulator of protease activity HflC (stomatin/prohibitin superfamily)